MYRLRDSDFSDLAPTVNETPIFKRLVNNSGYNKQRYIDRYYYASYFHDGVFGYSICYVLIHIPTAYILLFSYYLHAY